MSHAAFKYATWTLNLSYAGNSGVSATITDSQIDGEIYVDNCSNSVSLQRNQFALAPFALDPSDPRVAVHFSNANPSGLVLSGANENTFAGSGTVTTVQVDGGGNKDAIPAGATWTISASSNATAELYGLQVNGTLNLDKEDYDKEDKEDYPHNG